MKTKGYAIMKGKSDIKWDNGITLFLILIIILLPFSLFRKSVPSFTPIKELLLEISVLMALPIYAFKIVNQGSLNRQKSALDLPVLCYLLIGFLSLIWSVNIYNSILAIPLFVAGPVLFYIISNTELNQKKIERLLAIIIIVGTLMSVYGILQYLGVDSPFIIKSSVHTEGRGIIIGLFGNVNYFAEYLILPLVLTGGLLVSGNRVFNFFFLLFSFSVMGTALFLTFTRSSYLAVLITIPLMLFFYCKGTSDSFGKRFYKRLTIYFVLIVLISAALVYIPHPLNKKDTLLGQLRQRMTIQSLTAGSSMLRRVAIWKFTWMMIEDYPLLGSGLGSYNYHTLKYQAEFFSKGNNRDIYPHGWAVQAHNEYLQLWSELGIIGLLAFLWIVGSYYRNILRNLRQMPEKERAIIIGLTGGVTAVLVDAVFGFPLQLAASLSLFWLFMGLAMRQIKITEEKGEENLRPLSGKESDNKDKEVKINTKEISEKVKNNKSVHFKLNFAQGLAYFLIIIFTFTSLCFLVRPFVAKVYLYYGNQEMKKPNQGRQALSFYAKGLKWNPWQGYLYYQIGSYYFHRGTDPTRSLTYMHKAEKLIDYPYLPKIVAALYLRMKEYDKAVPYMEKAIKYEPHKKNIPQMQSRLGDIYLKIKEYEKAEQLFTLLIEKDPNKAENYERLAEAYINLDRIDEATAALEKVIELDVESDAAQQRRSFNAVSD
jgi:O-antigen ligase/Tfp pilus assembly protein PilF